MGAFQNIGVDGYLKRYGLKNGILRAIFLSNPFHFIKDYENKKILYYHKAKRYIEKKYYKFYDFHPQGLEFGEFECKNPIWIYWKQGLDNAPDIVKKCVSSVKHYAANQVVELDATNITQFVKLPMGILDKYEAGKISDAALSDLIRFSLLEHFGGTWIDATVLLTGKIPDYIYKSDFFAFQDTFGLIENPALISNWLLHCKPGNNVMRKTRNISFAYWENEKYVIDYLFTYMILQIVVEKNKEECGWFPYANSDYCHQYLNHLSDPYSDEMLQHITKLSTIHKLTYKLKKNIFTDKNTFYEKLMKGE